MSTYKMQETAKCRWCHGKGHYSFADYCGSQEEIFLCPSCGQHHLAEGCYLEEVTVEGGHGVLLARLNADARFIPSGPFLLSNGRQVAIRLTGDAATDADQAHKLIQCSDWVMRVSYDRDAAGSSRKCKHRLWKLEKKVEVLHGTPPSHDEIVDTLLGNHHHDEATLYQLENDAELTASNPATIGMNMRSAIETLDAIPL